MQTSANSVKKEKTKKEVQKMLKKYTSPHTIPPSIKLFVYFAVMLFDVSKLPSKQRAFTKQYPSTILCPQIFSPTIKGSGQLLCFTLRSLHQKFTSEIRGGHWNSYKCPLIPNETYKVSLPSPPSVNNVSRRAVSCLLSWPLPHCTYTHTHIYILIQILFWHNDARDDTFGQ